MANTNNGGQKKGGLITKIIGGAVLLLVVLLIVFVKSDKAPTDTENTEELGKTSDALGVTQPIVSGDYEYTFSGVKWIFDTESAEVAGTNQTWLKMEFADFMRNGNAIAFGRPYKLGVHPGVCKSLDFIDSSLETGIPIAYARCEGQGVVREFVVLQELENVVVKMNEKKGDTETGWKEWYSLNVTEIVR